MNILMLTHEFPPYPGGAGRYCASLAEAAARLGHHITVLAPNHGQSANDSQDHPGVNVTRFPGNVFHFKELPDLRSHIERSVRQSPRPFDIVHAADWPAIVALRKIPTKGSHRLATLHGSDILLMKTAVRARLARASKALSTFDSYACNSSYTQSLLRDHYPALAERSVVTPLGVDASWFEAALPEACQALAQRLGRQDDDLMVLTVARLDSRKGQLRTLNALGRLPGELKRRVHYVCVGKEVDEGYGDKLQAAASQLGVRLTLTGRIPDAELKAAYALAHVFALTGETVPKRVEGFGLVILEAAAQGLPAVVTKVQALPEVVIHGRTGWVCATDEELTQSFQTALEQAEHRSRHKECVEHAQAYTWERCAELTYVRGAGQA